MSEDDRRVLTPREIEGEGLDDWRVLFSTLHARFETGSFATGLALVNAIGEEAEAANHHPDLDLTYPRLDVRLSSHDVGGVTARDIRMARRISELAGEVAAEPRPEETSVIELALDTADRAEIIPFWAALLGYEPDGEGTEIADPKGTRPTVWFQATEPHDAPRQRWHLDVRVPPEVAEGRIKSALDAGGTMVSDDRAPRFWVLADPQGNKACITTWVGRDDG